MPHISLPR